MLFKLGVVYFRSLHLLDTVKVLGTLLPWDGLT